MGCADGGDAHAGAFRQSRLDLRAEADGIRMLAFKNGDDVKLYSRNRLLQHYPAVAEAIAELPVHDAILDGEAAWDPASRVAYHVFDILWLEGRSVMSSAARRSTRIAEDCRCVLRWLTLQNSRTRNHGNARAAKDGKE